MNLGRKPIFTGEYGMACRIQKTSLINDITVSYGGEPSAFAREMQMIFTRACNKAIANLRKKDLQPVGSDRLTPTPAGTQKKEEDGNEISTYCPF
jgi:hypothetical protein